MRKKKNVSTHNYSWFCKVLEGNGFKIISNKKIRKIVSKFPVVCEAKKGKDPGFSFINEENQLHTIVWHIGTVGFVLIIQNENCGCQDKLLYLSKVSQKKEKNIFYLLAKKACVAKWKITNVPICSSCKESMEITKNGHLHTWKCPKCFEEKKWNRGVPLIFF